MREGISPWLAGLLLVLVFGSAVPAEAGEAAPLKIELNKLEPQGEACRAYLVLENGSDSAFADLKLDMVMFDSDGVVSRRLAVQAAPLPAGKTSLKVFDIRDLSCGRLGRVLLNDVMACGDQSGPRGDCLALIQATARAPLSMIK
ncbi:hypothetical protein [Pelagibius sp.]|uniref:hypothetical protein n=1 Tax=Pelagibius sp. TaxID=1931238 RepID=UPI0026096D9E|nr:hypothetical protein [Pelagibius sp.]